MQSRGNQWIRATLLGALSLWLLTACASMPPQRGPGSRPLPELTREQLLGNWYILANVPYFAERGKVATRVEYVQRSDGRLDDLYYFRRELGAAEKRWEGVAWPLDASGARWKARFIWPFSSEFWVIDLSADGQIALIATPDAKLAWIYSRRPSIEPARYQVALDTLRQFGVDPDALVPIPQPDL
jgi:apolipoprotein D and lipocalin family protein